MTNIFVCSSGFQDGRAWRQPDASGHAEVYGRSDQLIAVTSKQRMAGLEQALQQLNKRRSAIEMIRMLQRYAPDDARIGSAGVFTAP